MKKILIFVSVFASAFALAGCSFISNSLMTGNNADITLSYTKYPEESLNHIKNIAVLPFQEGTLGSGSVWDYIRNTNPFLLLLADDLSNKLSERKLFRIFDRNVAQNESSIEMVIFGLVTENNVDEIVVAYESKIDQALNVDPRRVDSYSNVRGYDYYAGGVRGRLAINYRFVDPKTGEVLSTVKLEKEYASSLIKGESVKEIRSKLPDGNAVRKHLINQINNEFISTFTPTEVSANFAFATVKNNEQFKNSLIAAKNGNWAHAVKIWEHFEQANVAEALYNKMLYIRYIQKDLDEAIRYAKEAQEKTGSNSFNSWITRFEKEKELELKFKNTGTASE